MLRSFCSFCSFCLILSAALVWAEEPPKTREQKVREDKVRVEGAGFWIYNDLERGYAEARKTGKPLVVVLRCIPCEECVKLDDDLVDRDPVIRPLLEQFVCVRLVSTNGLDLSLFQYDTDQSFAVFLLNADRTIYGRFGTRSHRTEWVGDVSLKGLAQALRGALELHAQYPANQQALAGKTGPAPLFARPELFPSLQGKYTSKLNETGNIVQSCIHCHQIGDATRDFYRLKHQPLPDTVLFPYPHPKTIGLILDPHTRATVVEVLPGTPAAVAGLLPQDQIQELSGQPVLSIADVQWVLHGVSPAGGTVTLSVMRGTKTVQLTLTLPQQWRQADDFSWRSTTWGLRRMATGGLQLEDLSAEERQQLGVKHQMMALRVKHAGEYGPHAAAKNAGFRKGDILIKVDGRRDLLRETDLIRYVLQEKPRSRTLDAVVLRDGSELSLKLPVQD